MFSSLVKLVRPAAAVTAVVLVCRGRPGRTRRRGPRRPAVYAAVSISAHAVTRPTTRRPVPRGPTPTTPADAGRAPGSLRVSYEITNVGTDRSSSSTATPARSPSATRTTTAANSLRGSRLPSEDFELQPTQSIRCTQSISQIPAGSSSRTSSGWTPGASAQGRTPPTPPACGPRSTPRTAAAHDAQLDRPPRLRRHQPRRAAGRGRARHPRRTTLDPGTRRQAAARRR